MMFLRSKLGLPRTPYRTETNPVSKTGDVAVATRPGRDGAPETRNFVPFWLVSADVGRDEASTLSRRILGRARAGRKPRRRSLVASRRGRLDGPALPVNPGRDGSAP